MIDEALAAFLEGVPAQYVCTVDAGHDPSVGRAWGLRIDGGRAVRAVVGADAATVANLRVGGRVAMVVADVASYRAVQVKGSTVALEPPVAADHDTYRRYRRDFTAALRAAGRTTPMELVWPASITALTFEVDAVFDQTPGPGAGLALRGGS